MQYTNQILKSIVPQLFATACFLLATPVLANDRGQESVADATAAADAFVCFNGDFSFAVEAVTGWTIDHGVSRTEGVCAATYPTSAAHNTSPFAMAEAVFFITVTPRFREGALMTYDEVQAAVAERMREQKGELEIRNGDPISLAQKSVVVRKYFPDEAKANATAKSWDSFAFVEEKSHVVSIVLSARSRAAHDAAYQSFRNFVRTYRGLSR